jgi:uncharacterized protein YggU (UPF0235/DUF167 family)
MTQNQRIIKLLKRKCGATSMEIIAACGTTTPSKRLSEIRRDYTVLKVPVLGTNYNRYFIKDKA